MFKQLVLLLIISFLMISTLSITTADIAFKGRFANHSVCIDDSINENHGTYNDINFSLGVRNGAAVFNGVDSYIYIPHHNALTFTDGTSDLPFSVAFWINILEPNKINPIFTKGYTPALMEYIISTEGIIPKGNIILYDQVSGYQISCVTQDTLIEYETFNGWLHVIITYDGSSTATGLNMYFNGEPMPCDRTGHPSYACMTPQTGDAYIGREYGGMSSENLHGKLDEVIVYNHEIPDFQVESIYNEYKCCGYTMSLMKKNNILGNEGNISVYKNNIYLDTISYGDTIHLNNTYEYSFLLHEDMSDTLSNVHNIEDLSNTGLSYLVYAFIVIGVIALLIFMFRRF